MPGRKTCKKASHIEKPNCDWSDCFVGFCHEYKSVLYLHFSLMCPDIFVQQLASSKGRAWVQKCSKAFLCCRFQAIRDNNICKLTWRHSKNGIVRPCLVDGWWRQWRWMICKNIKHILALRRLLGRVFGGKNKANILIMMTGLQRRCAQQYCQFSANF